MPNIASAKKRVRQTETRTARNKKIKTGVKYSIKKFNEVLTTGDIENAKTALRNAVKAIDKATTKGVIHKNTAARKKSKLFNKLASNDS